MSLREEVPSILKFVDEQGSFLSHNHILFDIMEGDLLSFVLQDLKKQLSARSFEVVQHRVAPINFLKKLIDKLSKIYTTGPTRIKIVGTDSDQGLIDFYVKKGQMNKNFNIANENFNLYKSTWIEPQINKKGKIKFRSFPSDRFLVWSNNPEDQCDVTHIIKFIGTKIKEHGEKFIISITTDEEFIIVDEDGETQVDMMVALSNAEGVNPFGILNGVYINRSQNLLIPKADSDTLKMTKLFPVLLSDLNYAVMFQSFSIIWGIDISAQNLKMSPNAFWSLKSDNKGVGEKRPQVGQIKPQVDIDKVLNLIASEMALWLQSRSIKPGSIGKLTQQNFSSAVAKIVDEMDTFEDRQTQVEFFKPAEEEMFNERLPRIHDVWARRGLIKERARFSTGFEMETEFVDQRPMFDRSQVLDELEQEMGLGILSRKRAARRANPKKTDREIDEMLEEVDEERTVMSGTEGGESSHTHTAPGGNQVGADKATEDGLHSHNGTDPARDGEGHTHRMSDGSGATSPKVALGANNDDK